MILEDIIPSALRDLTFYYIKGGRASNIYMKEPVDTIDYDIVMDEETYKKFIDSIGEYVEVVRQSRFVDYTEKDYKFYSIKFKDCDVEDGRLVDVLIKSVHDWDLIDGLNYQPYTEHVKDLQHTFLKRQEIVRNLENRNIEYMNEVIEQFGDVRYHNGSFWIVENNKLHELSDFDYLENHFDKNIVRRFRKQLDTDNVMYEDENILSRTDILEEDDFDEIREFLESLLEIKLINNSLIRDRKKAEKSRQRLTNFQ